MDESNRFDKLDEAVPLADFTKADGFDPMRGLFVSMVAHELKAPLGAVEGYLHLLRDGAFDSQPEKRDEVLGRCLARTGALIELIQDLQQIAGPEMARRDRRTTPLDSVVVCNDLVAFHREDARRRGIRIGTEFPTAEVPVLVERGDLERVLMNLLSNAIKYNCDGGLITVRVCVGESAVIVEIRDTGIGMSIDEQKRLGEEFYRVNNERTRHIPGTGLGLALVKKTVESYGGALEVQSAPGEGSTFRIVLPLGLQATAVPPSERRTS